MGSGYSLLVDIIVHVCARKVVLEALPHLIANRNLFPLFTGLFITPVLRMSKYEMFTIFPWDWGGYSLVELDTLLNLLK